ncbi:MAG: GGDEF domain-containing protein, partial [Clostridium sp.]|nr:GGDEF domain-containing protein [Clostridium sp.]
LFIFYLEVLVHSVMALLCLGFRGGFDLYILIFIPVMFFSSGAHDKAKDLLSVGGIVAGVAYVALKLIMLFIDPRYTFSRASVEFGITVFNSVMCIFSLLFLSYIQCIEVNQARQELEEKNRKLTFLSSYDPMTMLMNRRSMEEVVDRIEEEQCFEKFNAVAFFDVDNFKRFNDDYGHECGDVVLTKVAEIIREGAGLSDEHTHKKVFTCRWGGEEIVILFHDYEESEVVEVVTRVKEAIEDYRLPFRECQLSVSVTCGIAFGSGEKGIRELINEADTYMLDGKKKGKNCIVMKKS